MPTSKFPAYMLVEPVHFPWFDLGDNQIRYCNPPAAELFGYDDPTLLIDQFMSDVQPEDWRDMGKRNWFLRGQGHTIPPDSLTVVRWPGGELAGQRRLLLGNLTGRNGVSYLMTLTKTTEIDQPPIVRNLAHYGETQEAMYAAVGRFTVAQIRELMTSKRLPTLNLMKLSYIIEQCEDLSTSVFGRPPGSGLAMALSAQVAYTLHEDVPKVRLNETCPHCHWPWKAHSWRKAQCPACLRGLPPRQRVVPAQSDVGTHSCPSCTCAEGGV